MNTQLLDIIINHECSYDHSHYHFYQNNILSRPQTLLVVAVDSLFIYLVALLKSRSASLIKSPPTEKKKPFTTVSRLFPLL